MAAPRRRLKERRQRATSWRAACFCFFGVLLLAGLIWVVHLPAFAITSVQVNGATRTDVGALRALASTTLSGSYFYIIPERVTFALPREALRADILAQFPVIQKVQFTVPQSNTLLISVTERTPVAVWCIDLATCTLIDVDGVLFGVPESGLRTYSGEPGMAFGTLDFYITRIAGVLGQSIDRVTVTKDDDALLDVGGAEFRIALSKMNDVTLDAITSVAASPKFLDGAVEYADFRFGNKALVKFSK